MKTVWHSGPPPEIGWWPASRRRNKKTLRWYDGITWSIGVRRDHTSREAGMLAKYKTSYAADAIEWTERWWV